MSADLAFEQLISNAIDDLVKKKNEDKENNRTTRKDLVEGLLYFGNPHESVPRQLILDKILAPVDKIAWQVIRLLGNGKTTFPKYDELQMYLQSTGSKASRSTVARVIAVLRLTRWLSTYKARHPVDGYVIGNIYLLHDQPLSVSEVEMLDSNYIDFVSKCLDHKNTMVRTMAEQTVEQVVSDRGTSAGLPLRITKLVAAAVLSQKQLSSQEELSQSSSDNALGSLRELSTKTKTYLGVSSENSFTVSKECNSKLVSTVAKVFWYEQILNLSDDMKKFICKTLYAYPERYIQDFADELAGRFLIDDIRKPDSYIKALLMMALKGKIQITDRAETANNWRTSVEKVNVQRDSRSLYSSVAKYKQPRSASRQIISKSIMDITDTSW